jgi:hypothetical protein
MATACVLFQRFYYAKSLIRLPFDIVAMSCLTLASKIEEAPRRNRATHDEVYKGVFTQCCAMSYDSMRPPLGLIASCRTTHCDAKACFL